MVSCKKFSFSSYEASADVRVSDVAIHPNGKIFATLVVDNKIQVFNDDLTPSYSFSGSNVGFLADIAIDTKGMLYVTDPSKGHVYKFTPEGKHIATIGSKGEKPRPFAWPLGICIDSNDIMYVTDDNWKGQVMMFTTDGEYLGYVDDIPSPHGVAVDKTGNAYVCSRGKVLVSKPNN